MKKEIGGYFELERLFRHEYYPDLIALNNASNALLYILRAKKIKKLYIPYFLCACVSELCKTYGYEYEYYEIDETLFPKIEKKLSKTEYLYVVNYYGQLSNEAIAELKDRYQYIIVDNVQAFFQKPLDNVDTIYSCRKFFGVPDGSYLATNEYLDDELECDVSKERMQHVLGRFEGTAAEYYEIYRNNEEVCKKMELRYMSKLTRNILGAIEYEKVKTQREHNYKVLEEILGLNNEKSFIMGEGAFCYPFYHRKGVEIRKQLAKDKIYVATLWPNVLENAPALERNLAANILPLPCDQRYGEEEMQYVAEHVKRIMKY